MIVTSTGCSRTLPFVLGKNTAAMPKRIEQHLAEELLGEEDGRKQLGYPALAVAGHLDEAPLRVGLGLRL